MSIIQTVVEKAVGPVIAGFWSHLHLFRYGSFKLREHQKGIRSYTKEEDFWKELIGHRFHSGGKQVLRLGDIVELKNFQIAEWFPRCPGTYWTAEGMQKRKLAQNDIEGVDGDFLVFGPQGKYRMVSGGIGTNRTLSHETQNGSYRILCATSSGICDAGIPIVCLDDVYSKIQEPLVENSGIEVDIKGSLVKLPFSIDQIIVPARGMELDQKLKDWLATALHIPRYFVLVESSQQVKKYISDFRIRASAWTLYDREANNGIIPSFTYATFDPRKSSSLERSTDFITKYVNDHSGVTIYTDFDEHVRRLEAKYNICDLMDKQYSSQTAENDLKAFLTWGRSVQEV